VKTKPNIDAFLEGGASGEAPPKPGATQEAAASAQTSRTRSSAPSRAAAPREFRKQMVMQLPVALINDLKRRALELSVNSGKRITQQQLVEEALRRYLYK
jgi:hypothetical protein